MPAIPDSFYTDLTTVKGRSRTTSEFQHLLNPPSVLIARGISITDKQRYQLVREVARGLAFLHRIGVCVGDISPKNVLFSLNPRPAVYFLDCDAMRVNGVSALPQMETPEWEVPAGEELATTYSDTYKLGLLALRLLAGDQHTKNPQELPPTTPKPLRQLITDTLTKKPDERPAPEAWTYLLRHVIDEAQQNATGPLVTPPAPTPLTYSPEPTPVMRSRTTAPTTSPVPSATGLVLTTNQKMYAYGAAAIVMSIVIGVLIFAGSQGYDTNVQSRSSTNVASRSSSAASAPAAPSSAVTTKANSLTRVEWQGTDCITFFSPSKGDPSVVGTSNSDCTPGAAGLPRWMEWEKTRSTGQLAGVDPLIGGNNWIRCTLWINAQVVVTDFAKAGDGREVSCLRTVR